MTARFFYDDKMVAINEDVDAHPAVRAKADDMVSDEYFACKSAEDCIHDLGDKQEQFVKYITSTGMPEHANYPEKYQEKFTGSASQAKALRADQVSWADVDKLREIWPGKLVIKGIMRADDARRAIDHGVDGIVVSNHGGRNMDSAPSTLDVLPGIATAVGDRTTIFVDSGVRRGSDIVKCLALGANAVLTGRATLYGIGAGGEAGAGKALSILKNEMRRTMAYIGKQRVSEINGDDIWRGGN